MIKKLTVDTGCSVSEVFVGERISNIDKYSKGRKNIILTDPTVNNIYGGYFKNNEKIIIGEGEKIKTLSTVEYIYNELLSFGADRNTLLTGVGGGIVSDIAGFAASTFMRGISYGFFSTTLLSQVDAGVGGKNGVNFKNIKNMIGTINQPEFVVIDTKTLSTLPEYSIQSGMGELVKHAVLEGNELFVMLDRILSDNAGNLKKITADETGILDEIIYRSLCVKSEIVSSDEKEKGKRRLLNLGHTVGHAVEIAENIPHGLAVVKGLVFSVLFSEKRGYISSRNAQIIIGLLGKTGGSPEIQADRALLKKIIQHDKKKENDSIYFVFLEDIGKPVSKKIPISELLEAIDDLCIGR